MEFWYPFVAFGLEALKVEKSACAMAKGNGKNFKNKGFATPHNNSKGIEKGLGQKKQTACTIDTNPKFVPIGSTYDPLVTPPSLSYVLFPGPDSSCAPLQGETRPCNDQLSGYIFMCSGKTKPECYKYRVFGLSGPRIEAMGKIRPNTKLFLFDFDSKLLYGVYNATSEAKLGLEPTAFGGKFPAQVRFEIFKECLPLPECAFKYAIIDNYQGGPKFKQELSIEQLNNIISLFCPIALLPQPAPVAPLLSYPGPPQAVRTLEFAEQVHPTHMIRPLDNQCLAGPAYIYGHGRQAIASFPLYHPHGSITHVARTCVQPASHRPHAGLHTYHAPYYPTPPKQMYVPGNRVLHQQHQYKCIVV